MANHATSAPDAQPPTPYYSDDAVTLYHADCREITAWLEADVLVTDPPYGMAYAGFGGRKGEPRRVRDAVTIAGDKDTSLRDETLESWGDRPALVFGTWRVPRPAKTRALLVWHKLGAGGMGDLSLPWLSSHEEIYVLGSGFTGKRSDSVLPVKCLMSADAERPNHPTPKPVGLMERLVEKTVGVVADPFAGSGSTLLAARNLGRKAIGVEVSEAYCEVIAKRLDQGVLDFGGVA